MKARTRILEYILFIVITFSGGKDTVNFKAGINVGSRSVKN
jgi:hypothetical protein